MAHQRRVTGYDPMELQDFNRHYSGNGADYEPPIETHAIDMNLPGTPQPTRHLPMDQRSDASSYHSEGGTPRFAQSPESQVRQAELLEALPSRQLETVVRSATSARKTMATLRRRKKSKAPPAISQGTLRYKKGGESVQAILDAWEKEDAEADQVDGTDVDEDYERQKQIKMMTLPLVEKKRMRKTLMKHSSRKKARKITCWKQFKYASSVRWGHFKEGLSDFAYFFRFWTGHLKTVEGLFGTGVTSYFKFLKWLFLINIPTFLLVVGFLVVPQLFYRFMVAKNGYTNNTVVFTGAELLTGAGWFTDTEMYYGYYTDQRIAVDQTSNLYYDMRFAYLCTTGVYFLSCLIVLGRGLSRSYRKNYIEGSSEFNQVYVQRVFAGWDYAITSPSSAKLKHKSIFKELQEFLAGYHIDKKKRGWSDICGWYIFRLGTNFFVLALICGSGYLIYFIADTNLVQNKIPIIQDMAMPLCMTGVNYILPFIFSITATFENYEQPKTELYVTMVRTMLLRGATLAVVISFWFRTAQCLDMTVCEPCWETFVGQNLYRLVIVDFAFIIVFTLITEFLRRAISQCITKLPHPEFNIGRNTLDLIYSQTLCWVGTYFSPFLVFINILKLFFTFYLKRVSVTVSCVPSSKAWRAARTHTIFLFFTLLSFILCVVTIACSIIFIPPSQQCGPFRNETSAYSIVTQEIAKLRTEAEWFTSIIDMISSVGFVVGLLVILCVVLFYMRILCHGRNKMVQLLKHQIQMEGKDKVFLLKMLQDVTCAAPDALKTIYSDEMLNMSQSARTPESKTFAKLQQQMGVEHHLMSPEKIKKQMAGKETPIALRRVPLVKEKITPGSATPPRGTPLSERRALMRESRQMESTPPNGAARVYSNYNQNNMHASQPELRYRQGGQENPSFSPTSPSGNGHPWHSHDNMLNYPDPQQRRY